MKSTSRPLSVEIPRCGVLAIESVHGPGFRMQRERHGFHELFYVFKGRLSCTLDGGEELLVEAGGFLPLRRDVWHHFRDLSPATVLILAFSRGFLEEDSAHGEPWACLTARKFPVVHPPPDRRERLEVAFRTILAEQFSELPGHEALVRAEAIRLLVALAREPDSLPETGSHARVRAVIRRLRERFHEPWDVESAARTAHLSRRRFVQIFRELTGMSLVEMRNQLRVEHAARLMQEGRATVIGAAFSSGFGDVSHFYRLFRRHYGVPPAEWRRRGDGNGAAR